MLINFVAVCPNLTESCNVQGGALIQTDTSCFECITCLCNSMSTLAESVFDLTPYFYPFSIEFSILVGE